MAANDDGAFDIIILGTGLPEAIAAAALAKAGFKVAHIDQNPYYGASEASLSFEELVQWQNSPKPGFSDFSRSGDTIEQARAYSISLSPSLIPSTGPLIDALVASGVAKYGGFRLIERICVYSSGSVKPVPGSKEDIFKNKEISLVDKRRLMRFLMFAAADFEDKKELQGHEDTPFPDFLKAVFALNDEMSAAIVYALAYCLSPSDPTLPALHRLRRYLRSAGRYGASPFLVGHYGSSGEIAQGFCRTAAVSGAVYILGREIDQITSNSPRHVVRLADFPDPLTCALLIAPPESSLNPTRVPPSPLSAASKRCAVARCVAIIDRALDIGPPPAPTEDDSEPEQPPPVVDTAVIVLPPASLPHGSTTAAATVLVTGEGTMSCPKGKWILYIALPLPDGGNSIDPKSVLRPYLDAVLALTAESAPLVPLFEMFYVQHAPEEGNTSHGDAESAVHLAPTSLPPVLPLPDAGDAAVGSAESVFWEAAGVLRPGKVRREAAAEDEDEEGVISSMWPPIEREEEEEEDI
ncbi:GDP dissociation inhibitor-domain-containing protein [Mycena crocata]|nr:GDP dissociation inhibitor-domain-containing protein [Mycena crocata]